MTKTSIGVSVALLVLWTHALHGQRPTGIWMTTADRGRLLSPAGRLDFRAEKASGSVIVVEPQVKFQTIQGFGFALTGGSATLIHSLESATRAALLKNLFRSDGDGIGISYLRVSIGASDLDDHVFSYDDLDAGKTDPTLDHFSLAPDREHLIPLLHEIVALRPDIKIMGSPWSPPVWMKSNGLPKGGSLLPAMAPTYAAYFVKYIQGMAAEGIAIDAVTVQNEPENPSNTPSMAMTAPEQNEFIRDHLAPAFRRANINTKIVLFDHNADHPDYPISILNDAETKKVVDGSAFHLYLGEVGALSTVHAAHPDRQIYFTEQWTSGKGDFAGDLNWHVTNLIVGACRNWSTTVLEWNLAADENFSPHTPDGGCDLCQGALTISKKVKKNVSYYIIGHASKFVPPGSTRIASSPMDGLPNVAFATPNGQRVLIVLNSSSGPRSFSICEGPRCAAASLPAGAVATFVWNEPTSAK